MRKITKLGKEHQCFQTYAIEDSVFKVNAHFFSSTSKPLAFSRLKLQIQDLAEVWRRMRKTFLLWHEILLLAHNEDSVGEHWTQIWLTLSKAKKHLIKQRFNFLKSWLINSPAAFLYYNAFTSTFQRPEVLRCIVFSSTSELLPVTMRPLHPRKSASVNLILHCLPQRACHLWRDNSQQAQC